MIYYYTENTYEWQESVRNILLPILSKFIYIYFQSSGAPMALSLPHFLYGDEQLINATDGIEPNETLHQSSIDIEPVSSPSYTFMLIVLFAYYE